MKKTVLAFVISCLIITGAAAQNYDESKVPAITLPELLITTRQQPVSTKMDWERIRRNEILGLFKHHVYGQMPSTYDSMNFSLTNAAYGVMGGKANLKEIQINAWKVNQVVHINLVLFTPTQAKKPSPVFLLINNRGNNNTDPSRKSKSEFWPAEMLIDSGYAIAAFHVADAAPDDKLRYQEGVLRLYPEQKQVGNGMKAIGSWAWGASRVMDYFEQDPDIDYKKVFVVGHSRGGKAALWAGANDQRFAMVFSNCSGNTGAALSRRKFGETITAINTNFPHWFSDNYKMYNGKEETLPVDQHMLIALIAPRPVYVTSATKDLWADPKGSYLSLYYAKPVYKLYGIEVPLSQEPPAVNAPVVSSHMGYHNREGEHNLTSYDWNQFIQFANYHLRAKKK